MVRNMARFKIEFQKTCEKKIAQATRIFHQIKRLSNTERGLLFQAIRQLYIACITSIADYEVPILWNNQKPLLKKFQRLQNAALRTILGAFKTSPIKAMEIEAAVPPPRVRFEKICYNYAIRIMQMNSMHPIIERVPEDFPPYIGKAEFDSAKFLKWNDLIHPETDNENERIQISEDSKEESAKKHQKMISEFQKDQHDDRIIIYTDGSKSETNQIGAGLVYTTNFSCYQWKAWNLGSKCEVFDAELFAIKKAIDFAYEKTDIWTREIWIFSDSQAALKRLKSREVRAGQYYTNQARTGIEKLRQKNNQM